MLVLLLSPSLLAADVRSREIPKSQNNAVINNVHLNITVIYDPTNELISASAIRIYFLIRSAYPYVDMRGAGSKKDLYSGILDEPDIAILLFNTTVNGVIVGRDLIPWQMFGSNLAMISDTEIILLLGNSYKLDTMKQKNWHYEPIEYDSIEALEVYALWETAKIMELEDNGCYEKSVRKLKEIAVSYYFENAKNLFEAKFNPRLVIGERDEEYREQKLKAYLDAHPESLQVETVRNDSAKKNVPIIQIRNFAKNPDDLWDYMPFPDISGLSGSIGDFIDYILDFLINAGCDFLSINISVIEDFVNVFKRVLDFVGDPSNLGEGSLLKGFLSVLGQEFPYISNYTKYLDMFIDGFYALKADLNSIVNFFTDIIDLILPEASGTLADIISQLRDIVGDILSIGSDVMNFLMDKTSNKINAILHYLIEKVVNISLYRLLENIPGISELGTIYEGLVSLIDMGFQLFTIQNITYFADKFFDLLTEGLDIFDSSDMMSIAGKLKNIVLLVVSYLEKKKDSLNDLAAYFIRSFVPQEFLSDNDLRNMIGEILDTVDTAIKEGWSQINDFKNSIENIINEYMSTFSEIEKVRSIITETITLITAIANHNFDISQTKSFVEILKEILYEYMPGDVADIEKIMAIVNVTVLPLGVLNAPSRLLKAFMKQFDPLLDMRTKIFEYLTNAARMIIEEIDPDVDIESALSLIENGTAIVNGILSAISEIKNRPFDGITTALILVSSVAPIQLFDEINIGNLTVFLKALMPDIMGLDRTPSLSEAINMILAALGSLNSTIKETMQTVLEFLYDIREVMRNGVKWFTTKILDWIAGYLADFVGELIKDLENTIKQFTFLKLSGDMNLLEMAGMDALTFSYSILITAGIEIDENGIKQEIKDIIIKGKFLDFNNIIGLFESLLEKITITPRFEAELKLSGMSNGANEMLNFLLGSLGADIQIEGEARFKIILFSFKSGTFDMSQFFDLEEWYLSFSLSISKTFSIFDLIGAPTLGKVAEELGLDLITVTLSLTFKLEINIGSQSENSGDHSILSLEITIAGTLHIGFDIVIAEVSIDFTLAISFIFTVDVSAPNPLTFTIEVKYRLKIHASFLFVGKTWKWGGTIFTYTFPEGDEKPEDKAGGFDKDNDGLPDKFETENFGFSPQFNDTDGDGLLDNEELNGYGTDPLDPDTDGDGLSDYEEIKIYGTNAFMRDTDGDRLSDYEEVKIYGTDPHEIDTDGDGLDDNFEVSYVWDISSVTISISGVSIGGEIYYDHTDPLNPDTDGDGLLDGQEGPMGGYYAPAAYDFGPNPIIFNYGYTHPLDNDTDDDSYLQMPDGDVVKPVQFLRSMTDKEEIDGITVVFVDPEEGPALRTFRTNPVCPDTDQDTGSASVLMGDGYELARDPPTDPLDGDSDDDGIVDGNEGSASPYSNKTDPLDPDTDDDNLGDLQEVLLGLDPGDPDTDGDMVSDGDEVLRFGTNPRLRDSDNDRLNDGEELFFWHSNPMSKDSDNDGIIDGDEVLIYFTDPMDEDTDNDNITDLDEIFIYHTNPLEADSDYDGIVDGDEVFIYHTNPLSWDSDGDSIEYPNEYGEMTWPMSDYREIFEFGTNPLDSDSDNDGISDALETYIASGVIPDFTPINLDAIDDDTDDDGLLDGQELMIYNVSDIIYPYISYLMDYPLNSSPMSADTDGDGLDDYEEIMKYACNANATDTDHDRLTDYEEVVIYNTSPIFWDTDKDNISDYDEVHGYTVNVSGKSMVTYMTDPTKSDTDNDMLPDGYEIQILKTDPTNSDEDGDGKPDGYSIDTDDDMLVDGLEFYVYNTSYYPGGGPLNPDSDCDGLSDGAEVYIYGTDPADPDTDDDGILDGAEVAAGTDPTVYTEWDDYVEALGMMLGDQYIKVLSPIGTIIDKYLDVRVINGTSFERLWFRYERNGEMSENFTLVYDPSSLQWVYSDIVWESGRYRIEVFGLLSNDTVLSASAEFEYQPIDERISRERFTWFWIGLVIGVALTIFVIFGMPRILKVVKAHREKRKKKQKQIEEGKSENVGGEENV